MDIKEQQKQPKLKAICPTCGKPISQKAESDVTRYLSFESRCTCATEPGVAPKVIVAAEQPLDAQEKADIEQNLGERYEVLSLLGRGGMGAVYKVRDKQLDKTFAIKVLNRQLVEDNSSVKRFEQEAKAASNLTHVNLAAVYDYGVGVAGSPYIIMDYLDGENLADILAREGYLDQPRAVDIFIQTAEAIDYAHSKGVIHRDIKPSNIIIEKREGDIDLVKLVDFGIAKVLPGAAKTAQMTQTGEVLGSPNYMSPEQCLGNKLDGRSDVYEMGCVMYEVLTGIAPFAADNPIKAILRHVNEEALPISQLKQDFAVPAPLESIVMHCLERDPTDRYQTAAELLKDLVAFRDGKAVSVREKASTTLSSEANRRALFGKRAALIMVATAMLFAACGISLVFITMKSPPAGNTDPYKDAERLDRMSYSYFMKRDYERAIPLLEFGIKTYKENGKRNVGFGGEDFYLADQGQHVGKCYLGLHKPAEAVPYYRESIRLYNKRGGGLMPEAVDDYATVLRQLGKSAAADDMAAQFKRTGRVKNIP